MPVATDRAEPLPTMDLSELESELLGLAGHIAAAECRFLGLLAEFDRRGGWTGVGIRSCAHWLTWRAGMSMRTATEHLRVAHALADLPRVTEAFAAGRISYSKVRAITRVTDAATAAVLAPAVDSDGSDGSDDPVDPARPSPTDPGPETIAPEAADRVLLDVALSGTASHVETVVRAARRRITPPSDLAARRGLSWRYDTDGSLLLRGRFTPEDGAALAAAIESRTPAPPRGGDPETGPPAGYERAGVERAPGAAVDRPAARRADALLELVQGHDGASAPVVAPGADVVVHVDAGTGSARIAGGPELPRTTTERLLCDARVRVLLDDRATNRLYLGRSRRLASPAQIAALTARDCADGGGCRFPGCGRQRRLHAHHVRHWSHGGTTDVDNLVLLCHYHHRLVHEHAYRIAHRDGGWEFRRADGTRVVASDVPLNGDAETLIEMQTRAGLGIEPDTLTPQWYGDGLDTGAILDALIPPQRAPGPVAA